MLTGQGLIGKLILFLAERIVGKKLDLSLDEKKRACRAFVELYYCTDKLEDITNEFLKELSRSPKEWAGWEIPNLFAIHAKSLDSMSSRFIEIGAELHWAVELYDEVLAEAVIQLYQYKYSFLLFASESIEVLPKGEERNRLLKYPAPSSRILDLDMGSYYRWLKTSQHGDFPKINHAEWPANVLAYSIFGDDFPEVTIEVNDAKEIAQFAKILVEHGEVLSKARIRLREFIKNNFDLEDVLYVSKKLEHYNY